MEHDALVAGQAYRHSGVGELLFWDGGIWCVNGNLGGLVRRSLLRDGGVPLPRNEAPLW